MLRKIFVYNNYDIVKKRITGDLKEPIILGLVSPGLDYTEQITVKQVYDSLIICDVDNLFFQDKIRESYLNQGWGNLTILERDIVINASVGDNNIEKATHLFSTGKLTFTNDSEVNDKLVYNYLSKKWVKNHPLNVKACVARHSSERLLDIMSKYLTKADSEDLQHTARGLAADYISQGIRGVIHMGDTYGLLDYFNSTEGTVYEDAGLKESKNYTMQNGDINMDNFIFDLLDVFLYGNY